jgi:RNA polymerase sigma factor (sigma-70 family)
VNEQSDQELLRNYADRKSDSAFAALVERYVDLVHSAAFRMSSDPHSAKDITQCVFLALAQNAQQLTARSTLAGWLHNTARNLAAKEIRSHIRRRTREQEAAAMNKLLTADPAANWEDIAPHLDAALGELNESERDALLLRYFKNEDLRTVGVTLGISDDAAQKRVSRAVERLREFFAKRGITVGASGLVVVISANAVQAAPIGLALTISTAATLTGQLSLLLQLSPPPKPSSRLQSRPPLLSWLEWDSMKLAKPRSCVIKCRHSNNTERPRLSKSRSCRLSEWRQQTQLRH